MSGNHEKHARDRGSALQAAAPSRTRQMMASALLASLLAAAAWIVLPVGAVPVTLQVLIVLLAGLLLSPAWAFAAVLIYVLLGAIGVPVFSGAQGGLGILAGPTGGYILGFLAAAPLVAFVRRLGSRSAARPAFAILAVICGLTVIYACGWLQLALVLELAMIQAFAAGVAPFLLPDVAKAAVAVAIASALRRAGLNFD